jgi:hypothetical protein
MTYKTFKRFANDRELAVDYSDYLKYKAGHIVVSGKDFIIAESQGGAEETFSIGQPVYSNGGMLLGYLGLTMYDNLNYSNSTSELKLPVERWCVCLPTKYCTAGLYVKTYWQKKAGQCVN